MRQSNSYNVGIAIDDEGCLTIQTTAETGNFQGPQAQGVDATSAESVATAAVRYAIERLTKDTDANNR